MRPHVCLKFMLMSHKYCERLCGKGKRTMGKSLLSLYPHFLIFKMKILTLALKATQVYVGIK